MRYLILATLFGMLARQPSKGVAKKQSIVGAQLAQHSRDEQQTAQTATLNAILAARTKEEQDRAAERQQEAAIEAENIHLQRRIVSVGIAQAFALIGTLIVIGYQAIQTAKAAVATSDATKAIQTQVRLMDKEFIAAHRPKLRFRRFMMKSGQQISELSVEIINVGENTASIIESHCSIEVSADETEVLKKFNDEIPNDTIPKIDVLGGQSIGKITLPIDAALEMTHYRHLGGAGFLYAIGWVRYMDANKIIRKTGFFRKRDPETGLFRTDGNTPTDYEYED
jgi:hypothetical protein